MRRYLLLTFVVLTLAPAIPANAQQAFDYTEIAAPRQPGAIPLDTVPSGTPDREQWMVQNGIIGVRNVTVPTLTPILPVGPSTGAAMIVAPGGAFLGLAIEHEGWQVARWLANHGIAAFVLKYRVQPTPASNEQFQNREQRDAQWRPSQLCAARRRHAPPKRWPTVSPPCGMSANMRRNSASIQHEWASWDSQQAASSAEAWLNMVEATRRTL